MSFMKELSLAIMRNYPGLILEFVEDNQATNRGYPVDMRFTKIKYIDEERCVFWGKLDIAGEAFGSGFIEYNFLSQEFYRVNYSDKTTRSTRLHPLIAHNTDVITDVLLYIRKANMGSIIFEFNPLTKDDLNSLELTDGFYSPYNIKALYMDEIVGYIVVEERKPNFVLNSSLSKELHEWSARLNDKKWLCIRKIYFQEQYLYSGNLENMFDKFVSKLPDGYNLWCNISRSELNQYITQIGGFADLPNEICPNTSVRIFNVYQRNKE